MEDKAFNYNLLTKTSDKVIYIVLTSIASVVYAICFVELFFYIDEKGLTHIMSISFLMCCMYMIAIIGGAKIIKVAINALCVSGFLIVFVLSFPLLDSIFKFQFGLLVVLFGPFVLILPNILLLLNKIPIRIFLGFFFAVNILTFGLNFL